MSKRTIKIKVSEEHIKRGGRSASTCPIALAIKEKYPEFDEVVAGIHKIKLYPDHKPRIKWVARTPQECYLFIVEFDNGGYYGPFETEVEFELSYD